MKKQNRHGFTLVELLIVIAIIAILAAVAYVAIDPATRIKDANDAQRWSDSAAIVEATMEYIVDNDGSFPNESSWSTGVYYTLGSGTTCTCTAQSTATTCLNLTDLTANDYLASIPQDPVSDAAADTDYYVYRSTGGLVTVGACEPQNADEISVSR